MNLNKNKKRQKTAFTLIEILIVLIILTILALILVPRLTQRVDKARISVALTDIRALERAQNSVEIDTGYFVRLFVLNDTRGRGFTNDLSQYPPGIEYTIDPESGFLVEADLNNETLYQWYGPYITWERPETDNPYLDLPLDPWGMPYLLFSHRGLVEERGEAQTQVSSTFDVFNHMTILSMGPDRRPGIRDEDEVFATPGSDDIYRSF